ncbi:MAG: hypothetical protein LQ340_005672 [Diploschistes diacapsis]|nr:MAG: hypothetical protein LQ340_005672 [Diploschistes diacapsis]
MLRSRNISSSSRYQPVESSEYDVLEHEGLDPGSDSGPLTGSWIDPDSHISSSDHDDWSRSRRGSRPSLHYGNRVRTVSRPEATDFSQPTPGSRTSTNIANIERLEQSAERISVSSDIGEEVKKLHDRQKLADSQRSSVQVARQYSTTSHPSSIVNVNSVAHSRGFSPEAYVASPSNSVMSPWSIQSAKSPSSVQMMDHASSASRAAEPAIEGRPLDFPPSPESKILRVRNSTEQDRQDREDKGKSQHLKAPLQDEKLDRSNSAASGDTFQRAHDAFADFDGVHIDSDTPEVEDESYGLLDPEASLVPPDDGEPVVTYMPPDHENMIYYPAPVPMMLNLPAKLSKGPSAAQLDKRRSEIFRSEAQASQSAPDLLESNDPEEAIENFTRKRASNVPSQLRASTYFDQPSIHHDIEIIDGSAVRTLDSILDASAHAPVAAFTDHPMAGQEGGEIYSSDKHAGPAQPSPAKPKAKRRASSFFAFGAKLRGLRMTEAEQAVEENADEDDDAAAEPEAEVNLEEDEDYVPTQRPSTLLAELQIRKAQQKQRNRTAATAFPHGMHSTLLQLDAVAQVQKQARKQKQISLVWEDPNGEGEEDPDEDTPLGLLYPSSKQQQEPSIGRYPEDRPLGLLAQKYIEENEPLSRRRARLHGAHKGGRVQSQPRASSYGLMTKVASNAPRIEDEGETLGQMQRRLRGDQGPAQSRPLNSDFASEVLSQLGVGTAQDKQQPPSKTPDPEETLGARKRRLKAEQQARQASSQSASQDPYAGSIPIGNRHNMASLLQSNPVGPRQMAGTFPSGTGPGHLVNAGPKVRHASTFQQPTAYQHPVALQRSRTDQPIPVQPQSVQYHQSVPKSPYQSIQYPNPMAQHIHYPHSTSQQIQYPNRAMAPYAQLPSDYPGAIGQGKTYYPPMPEETNLQPQQRAMIDRWRQSVI